MKLTLRFLQKEYHHPAPPSRISTLIFEDKIGESIARHVWDAGVLAFCVIAESCMLLTPTDIEPSGLKALKAYSPGQNLSMRRTRMRRGNSRRRLECRLAKDTATP